MKNEKWLDLRDRQNRFDFPEQLFTYIYRHFGVKIMSLDHVKALLLNNKLNCDKQIQKYQVKGSQGLTSAWGNSQENSKESASNECSFARQTLKLIFLNLDSLRHQYNTKRLSWLWLEVTEDAMYQGLTVLV